MTGTEDDGLLLPRTGDRDRIEVDPLDREPTKAVASPATAPRYADVHTFVTQHLAHAWARNHRDTDTDFRWCPRWAEHPFVVERLTDLWQAYEQARATGGSEPLRWWREADNTIGVLTAVKGPFARCGTERHQEPAALPTTIPRAGSAEAQPDQAREPVRRQH